MRELNEIKKGDAVTVETDNNQTVFYVTKIIKNKEANNSIVLLKGVTSRIETSGYLKDLHRVEITELKRILEQFENKINSRTDKIMEGLENGSFLKEENTRKFISEGGKILHLDGDKHYATKSSRVYSKFGLNAIVKNITESKQPYEIKRTFGPISPRYISNYWS